MRLLVAAPVLGLPLLGLSLLGISLLGMGGEPRILLSERVDPAATADPPNLNVLEARPVSLHIVNGFSAEEEAKIIAAVGDWNQKGGIRVRVAALNYNTVESGAWSIMKADGPLDVASDDGRLGSAVLTHRISAGEGSIVVHINRLDARDLRAVVAHELFLAIGSGDDPALSPNIALAPR